MRALAAPVSTRGTATGSIRKGAPAPSGATQVKKPVSPIAIGAALLIAVVIIGGGIWVIMAGSAPAVPTGTKPPSGGGGQTPPNNTGPKPPDGPKQPDVPKQPDNTKPPVPLTGILIKGSGSTFIQPAMEYWTKLYEEKTGVQIKYRGNGSGSGIQNMIDKVSDFGCTDAPMTDAQLLKAKNGVGEVLHIPLAMGAVVVTYNLDVKDQLIFRGEVLAEIYLGKITKWNDPAIQQSNPGVELPNLPITVIHRADSSGTTAIWTEYLGKVNKAWLDTVGPGATTVKWPIGEDAEKNDGVAKAVSRTVGSIGYVELSYALERSLKYAKIKNKLEKAIQPSLDSVTSAATASLQEIKSDSDLRYSLTNPPGEESYPISGTTWMVVYLDQTGEKLKGKELVKFLQWAMDEGQPKLKDLRYAPLPPKLVARVKEKINNILTN
jgi:phosphate transport system substrate-binding protein